MKLPVAFGARSLSAAFGDVRSAMADTTSSKPYRLYSGGQVSLATLLGAPLAGSVLIALNYRRLGASRSAHLSVLYGFLSTFALLLVASALPAKLPHSVLPAACTALAYGLFKRLQGDAFASHIRDGGLKASTWAAAGIGVLCLVIILFFLFGTLLLLPEG